MYIYHIYFIFDIDYSDVEDLVQIVSEKSKRSSIKHQQQQQSREDREKKQPKKSTSYSTTKLHNQGGSYGATANLNEAGYAPATEEALMQMYRFQDPRYETGPQSRMYASYQRGLQANVFEQDASGSGASGDLDTSGSHTFPPHALNSLMSGVDLDVFGYNQNLSPTALGHLGSYNGSQLGHGNAAIFDASQVEGRPATSRLGRKKNRDYLNNDPTLQQLQQDSEQALLSQQTLLSQNSRRRKQDSQFASSNVNNTPFESDPQFQQGVSDDKKGGRRGAIVKNIASAPGAEKRIRKPSVKVAQQLDDIASQYDEFGLPLTTPSHVPRSLKKRMSKGNYNFPAMNPYGQTMPSGLTPHLGGMNLYQSPSMANLGQLDTSIHHHGIFSTGPSPMPHPSDMEMVSPDFFGHLPETPFSNMLEQSDAAVSPHCAVFDHTGFTPTDPNASVQQQLAQQLQGHRQQHLTESMASQGSTAYAADGQAQDEDGDSDFSLSPSLFTSPKVQSSATHAQYNPLANISYGDISFSKLNSPEQLVMRSNLGDNNPLGSPIPRTSAGLSMLADGCIKSAMKNSSQRMPLASVDEPRNRNNGPRSFPSSPTEIDHGSDEFSSRLLSSNMIDDKNILISAVKAPRHNMLNSGFGGGSDLRLTTVNAGVLGASSALKSSLSKTQRDRSPENKENEFEHGNTTATKKKRVGISDEKFEYSYIESHTYGNAGVSPDLPSDLGDGTLCVR